MKSPSKPHKFDEFGNEVIKVPLHIAPISPFTIITFDEGDEPEFTLEQVNSRTYDRLKICRTTTALDPMLSAMDQMAVIVSYTGALLFPRMPKVCEEDVLASANRLLLKMTLGGIEFDAIAPSDIGFGFIYGTGYYLAGGGAVGPNFTRLMALQQQDAGSFDTMKLLEPRVYTSSELHAAVHKGAPIVDEIPEINPNLFLNGLTYFRQYQLSASLVFLWSTCESLIGRLWNDHVVPIEVGITHRKRFIEGNGWQAAQKIEVLFQKSLIDNTLYEQLSRARSARNALAHKSTDPNIDDCKAALISSFRLVSVIRSCGRTQDEFVSLTTRLASKHDPQASPIEPKYWREIPSVPGDEKWKGAYPKHTSIELVPIMKSNRKSDENQ